MFISLVKGILILIMIFLSAKCIFCAYFHLLCCQWSSTFLCWGDHCFDDPSHLPNKQKSINVIVCMCEEVLERLQLVHCCIIGTFYHHRWWNISSPLSQWIIDSLGGKYSPLDPKRPTFLKTLILLKSCFIGVAWTRLVVAFMQLDGLSRWSTWTILSLVVTGLIKKANTPGQQTPLASTLIVLVLISCVGGV